jgi:hypothetical protein
MSDHLNLGVFFLRVERVTLGRERRSADGCRRYRPIRLTFDTRNVVLGQQIGEDWEPALQAQWRQNQAGVRMGLLAEHGTDDGEQKIADYQLMGPAPWSIAFEHNPLMTQVRSAFAHGDYYPALVGACALGERILNQLILTLRDDYDKHPATTKRVRRDTTFTHWEACIDVLHGWGVLPDPVAVEYRQLKSLRDDAVHFVATVPAGQREPALAALKLIQSIIQEVFSPLGGPPRYIGGTAGASFIALEAEAEPFVRRILLPRSALLSPAHRFYPGSSTDGLEWTVVDDADYDPTPLTDDEFVAAIPGGTEAMHPELMQLRDDE